MQGKLPPRPCGCERPVVSRDWGGQYCTSMEGATQCTARTADRHEASTSGGSPRHPAVGVHPAGGAAAARVAGVAGVAAIDQHRAAAQRCGTAKRSSACSCSSAQAVDSSPRQRSVLRPGLGECGPVPTARGRAVATMVNSTESFKQRVRVGFPAQQRFARAPGAARCSQVHCGSRRKWP